MKRLINSTTIIAMALYVVPPFAAQAQEPLTAMVGDTQVICLPNKEAACPEGALCVVAKTQEKCQTKAEAAVAKGAAASKGATEQTSTEQQAADQAAADKAAAEKAAADQAAADKAAAEKAAAEKAAADQAAAEKAAADKAAAEKAAADQKAADQNTAAGDATAAPVEAPAVAAPQAFPTVTVNGTEVICLPTKAEVCPEGATCVVAAKKARCETLAQKKLGGQTAADQTAADQTTTQPATTEPATTEPATAPQTGTDQNTADQTQPATDANTAPATDANTAQAEAPAVAAPEAYQTVEVNGSTVICLPTKADICPEGATCVVAAKKARCETLVQKKLADKAAEAEKLAAEQKAMDQKAIEDAKKAQEAAAAAAAADPNLKPVEAPVPDQQAVQTLQQVLQTPATGDQAVPEGRAPEAAAEVTDLTTPPAEQPAPKDAKVTTETVTEADTRSSAQDFAAAPVTVAPGKKSHLSDLEKAGLVALGALVIGTMINNSKQEVVQNTGDRVVVRQDDGSYQVYKDDNSLLREPGSKVTTQTFNDGSTRTIVTRQDGTQISTIRDASGRVLQRVAYDRSGRPTVLIDDLKPEERVDVSRLPIPRYDSNRISVDNPTDAELRAALAAAQAEDLGQKFSLRQIRTIERVRYLAPTIDVRDITFETGSAAIQPTEAKKLNKLGTFISGLIRKNPNEVFLIEGHTDAVGSAAYNLALSDRRAESVAKALTEYFGVPPENLVVQGYGESELLVDTQGDERANRRVAVRIITPLLRQ